MTEEEIKMFIDAADKCKAGDKNAFEGMEITLDGDKFINQASGPENKNERKRQDD